MARKGLMVCEKCGVLLHAANRHPNRNFCERCGASASIDPQSEGQLSMFDLLQLVDEDNGIEVEIIDDDDIPF